MAIRDLKDNLKRLKDADPVEIVEQVNAWVHDSGEAIRLRVEDEVERAVTKRGFVKRSEFLKLEARISELENLVGASDGTSAKSSNSMKSKKFKKSSKGAAAKVKAKAKVSKQNNKVNNKVNNKLDKGSNSKKLSAKGRK